MSDDENNFTYITHIKPVRGLFLLTEEKILSLKPDLADSFVSFSLWEVTEIQGCLRVKRRRRREKCPKSL